MVWEVVGGSEEAKNTKREILDYSKLTPEKKSGLIFPIMAIVHD